MSGTKAPTVDELRAWCDEARLNKGARIPLHFATIAALADRLEALEAVEASIDAKSAAANTRGADPMLEITAANLFETISGQRKRIKALEAEKRRAWQRSAETSARNEELRDALIDEGFVPCASCHRAGPREMMALADYLEPRADKQWYCGNCYQVMGGLVTRSPMATVGGHAINGSDVARGTFMVLKEPDPDPQAHYDAKQAMVDAAALKAATVFTERERKALMECYAEAADPEPTMPAHLWRKGE